MSFSGAKSQGREMMSEPKHTPGPWKLDEITSSPYWGRVGTAYASIADVQLWMSGKSGDNAIALANARLIAAAPELLDALKTARRRMLKYGEDPREIAEITEAIAKAEGQVAPLRAGGSNAHE